LISHSSTTANLLAGNFIGTDFSGTMALGNGHAGIDFDNAPGNTVGGTAAGLGNLISANAQEGVLLAGFSTTGNLIQGNRIGTNVGGTSALGNLLDGVSISQGAAGNTIGGASPGAGNTVSGNHGAGLSISFAAAGNLVQGDFIGTDFTGTTSLSNASAGILIQGASSNTIGGTTTTARNVISGNQGDGIDIFASTPAPEGTAPVATVV